MKNFNFFLFKNLQNLLDPLTKAIVLVYMEQKVTQLAQRCLVIVSAPKVMNIIDARSIDFSQALKFPPRKNVV